MAQKRRSQRGVMHMASTMILAGLTVVLGLAGCSSEQSAPAEHLGSSAQALTCNPITGPEVCNNDDCSTFNCKGITGGCLLIDQKADGAACEVGGTRQSGTCVTPPNAKFPVCCTGCVGKGVDGLVCRPGNRIAACGLGGTECKSCDTGNSCVDSCQKGECVEERAADGDACREAPGFCNNAACCTGCVDEKGVCQKGTTVAACGNSVAANGIVTCAACNDGKVCTADACNANGKCVAPNEPDGKACPNATKCDGDETCKGGACAAVPNFMCPADMNACHAPSCDPVAGCSQKNLTGTNCPDANLCNGTEKCNAGVCNVPGTPKSCDDNNPCTVDDCDPKTGNCINTALAPGELCENGDVCDGIGICNASAKCVVEPPQACDNSDPCKVFTCDKTKGCVVSSFTTSACNDGDPCTTVDKCNGAGSCVGGTQQKCDDGNECTADSCVAGQGCKAVAANEGGTCDDGNACSTGDKCVAGKCKSSGGTTCPDDTNPCTNASCDPGNNNSCGQTVDPTLKCQTDKCHQFTQCGSDGKCPVGALIDCADTNPCTKDSCDPATGCKHEPDDTATCSDSDLCTESTSCQDGACVAKPVVCEALSDCHKVGICNDKSGFCDAPRADVGTACENDTGKCDDKGKCVPNPTTGEGGAGGEPTTPGTAGDGTGGTVTEGGKGTVTPVAGEGNEPGMGGEPGTVGTGGNTAGKSSGGSASHEGGAADVPEHVFVRTPGGCSCTVPASPQSNLAWLGGLALIGGALARRRARLGAAAARGTRLS